MSDAPDPKALDELSRRIKDAQADKNPGRQHHDHHSAAGAAWRMVIELVVGMGIGFGIGYGLDSLFGTLPIFLILFTLLGFAAGVRTMMRTAAEIQEKNAEAVNAEKAQK